jgi:4-hydroxy-tetrahydrodipicolinate synthase
MQFQGTFTALVTPVAPDGSVDYPRLRELVERQIAAGITGLVPVGTTGESPTLTPAEHLDVIRFVIETAAKRVPVIAGTGANSTAEALDFTKQAIDLGADATLQVTPYYNKPNATGLLRHFTAVADLGIPVVLYNIPGRTSREIPLPVVAELARHPNIACIKEAGGNVNRVSQIRSLCDIAILSGDDALTLPMMALGASGVVSVATHLAPGPVCQMVAAALAGDWEKARALHYRLYPLFTDLFLDTNPIPVKAALEMAGFGPAVDRLPLAPMDPAPREKLRATLASLGLLPPERK